MRKLTVGTKVVRIRGKIENIFEVIQNEKTVTISELQEQTKINYNTIRSAIRNLVNYGLIEQIDRGTYRLKEGVK